MPHPCRGLLRQGGKLATAHTSHLLACVGQLNLILFLCCHPERSAAKSKDLYLISEDGCPTFAAAVAAKVGIEWTGWWPTFQINREDWCPMSGLPLARRGKRDTPPQNPPPNPAPISTFRSESPLCPLQRADFRFSLSSAQVFPPPKPTKPRLTPIAFKPCRGPQALTQ